MEAVSQTPERLASRSSSVGRGPCAALGIILSQAKNPFQCLKPISAIVRQPLCART